MRIYIQRFTIGAIIGTAILLTIGLLWRGLPKGSVYNPGIRTYLSLFLATLVTLYPLIRNFALAQDPFGPVVIIGGLLFLYFPFPAFGIAILTFSPTFPSFLDSTGQTLPAFTWALVAISLGGTAFYVGFRYTERSQRMRVWPKIAKRRVLISNIVIIWSLSLALELLTALEVLNSGNALIYHLTEWHYLSVLVLLASYFYSKGRVASIRLLTFIIMIEAIFLFVVEFQLKSLLILIVVTTLAYHYTGPGLTYRKLAALGGSIAVLFPLSEIVESIQAGGGLGQAVNGTLGILWYLDAFMGRMIGIDALTMIIHRTPELVPYQWGGTLLFAIYGLVPRAIWSGKPSIIMCGVNNQYFSGRGVDANTCAAMTAPAEFYWNFGTAGIILGLLLVGLLLGGLYRWFMRNDQETHQYASLVVYAVIILPLMQFESGTGQIVSNIIKNLGFGIIFLWLVTEPVRPSTFSLNGNSAVEHSRAFRFVQWLLHSGPVITLKSILPVQRILSVPQGFAQVSRKGQLYATAVSIDKRLITIQYHFRESYSKISTRIGPPNIYQTFSRALKSSYLYQTLSRALKSSYTYQTFSRALKTSYTYQTLSRIFNRS